MGDHCIQNNKSNKDVIDIIQLSRYGYRRFALPVRANEVCIGLVIVGRRGGSNKAFLLNPSYDTMAKHKVGYHAIMIARSTKVLLAVRYRLTC